MVFWAFLWVTATMCSRALFLCCWALKRTHATSSILKTKWKWFDTGEKGPTVRKTYFRNEAIYQIDGKKRYFAHQLLELGLASSFLECLNFLWADVGHSKGLGFHQLWPQTQVLHAPIGESTVQAAHDLDEIVPAQGADKKHPDIYLTLFFPHLPGKGC